MYVPVSNHIEEIRFSGLMVMLISWFEARWDM